MQPRFNQVQFVAFQASLAFLLMSCAAIVITLMVREYQIGMVRVQLDYEEGNILNAGVRILNGLTPYPIPKATPEALNPYGPTTYYFVALLLKTFGIGFSASRVAVLLFGLACGSVVGLLVRHFTGSWMLAVGAAVTYVLMDEVMTLLLFLRVDFIGLCFALLGLYIYALRPQSIVLCAVLFAIALFTKHTFLAAPATCFIEAIRRRRYSNAALFASVLGIICLTGFGIMQIWTHSAFAFHMFQTHPDPISLRKWAKDLYSVLSHAAPFTVMALWYAGVALKERLLPFPLMYLVMATLATLTAAKAGSTINHMLEFLAALTVCSALGIYTVKARGCRFFAATLLVLLAFWLPFRIPQRRLVIERQASKPGACLDLYDYVGAVPVQHILSENIGALVLAHKPVGLSNPFVYTQLVRAGKWSDDDLVQKLESQQFDLIVRQEPWDRTRWTDRSIAVIEAKYRVAASFACRDSQLVLVPVKRGGQYSDASL